MKYSVRAILLAAFAFTTLSHTAMAKTDGILVLGTQEEVLKILHGSRLEVNFSEQNPSAIVAVRMTKGEIAVYEREACDDIVKFVGKLVKGGVVITIKVGTALWDLLEDATHCTVEVGEKVLKAACWVLCHTEELITDGVKCTVQTVGKVLEAVKDLLECIIHG